MEPFSEVSAELFLFSGFWQIGFCTFAFAALLAIHFFPGLVFWMSFAKQGLPILAILSVLTIGFTSMALLE